MPEYYTDFSQLHIPTEYEGINLDRIPAGDVSSAAVSCSSSELMTSYDASDTGAAPDTNA